MAELSLRHIDKVYDNNVQAVFDFNLEIKDKEFIVFVGPSGCGKSTTLRMIAGLEDITAGEFYIECGLRLHVESDHTVRGFDRESRERCYECGAVLRWTER